MLNKILYAPGLNKNELIETISKFSNKKEFLIGLRIMGTSELSKYLLMKNGVTENRTFISNIEEEIIISALAKTEDYPYFASSTLEDAANITSSINSMRMLLRGDESILHGILSKGLFKNKNNDIYNLYQGYLDYCNNHNLIDNISLANLAINLNSNINEEIYLLSEYLYKPLEEELVKHNFNNIKKISLKDIIGSNNDFHIASYTKSYGAINEVEHVINYIYQNNLPLDECLICNVDASYNKRFYDLACNYNIPITNSCGLPIYSSNPGKLLKLILDWETTGYNGLVSLNKIIDSECFNRKKIINDLSNGDEGNVRLNYIMPIVGHLRLSFNSQKNNKLFDEYINVANPSYHNEYARKFKDILNKGLLNFLKEYAVIKYQIDELALKTIEKLIVTYECYNGYNVYEMIPLILNKIGCTSDATSGAIHICDINTALSYARKNVFITGLGSKNFPGNPREDYLLLDCDYELFNEENCPTSNKVVENNKKMLFNLLDVLASIKANIHLSYSYFNLSDIKEENASSILFEIYKKEYGMNQSFSSFKKMIESNDVGFFDAPLSNYYLIGKSYINGDVSKIDSEEVKEDEYNNKKPHAYSPTEIESYFNCPYAFYLKRMLGLKELVDEDPFESLTASDTGIVAHKLMEELDKNFITKEMFLQNAAIAYDNYDKIRNSVQKNGRSIDREHFLDMMGEAYMQDPGNQIYISETKQDKTLHVESDVLITGQPDRVELDKDGKFIVVDFKTKNSVAHKENDIDTCIQVLIYAYLVEQNNKDIKIDHCEYRYFKLGETVKCVYNDEMRNALGVKLKAFKFGITKGIYKANIGDNCKYCKFKSFCGGVEASEDDTNEL